MAFFRNKSFVIGLVLVLSLMLTPSLQDSFGHEDEGKKQRDDRIHMTITNDSPNQRTGVAIYYTAISHSGHDHPWIGDQGVIICELGLMNPGQSKTCHGPFHSAKSPDQKPECNPTSDWNFNFLISYNEGGNQKSTPLQRGTITSITGDKGESRNFSWDSHAQQVFIDTDCLQPEVEEPAPMVAPDPPNPPSVSIDSPEGDTPHLSGTGDEGTTIKIFINEIGFFGFNFFSFYEITVDEDGMWSVNIEGPLDNGVYDVIVVSVDGETGLMSEHSDVAFEVNRKPAPEEDKCPKDIEEPSENPPSIPFAPLPRINGTTDLDPDLERSDQGRNDCALIAVTNNLNYFVNSHNIPRGGPNQLPEDDSQIVEQLRIDMNWQEDGVIDSDFLSGKNTFVERYGLPITTTIVDFPTPEQIKEALEQGKAIELNFQFKKRGQTLGHTVTVVGISDTSDGVTIQIHDPMTKGQKTQDSYELRRAQDRNGNEFWILMDYPNWDGYTILERMFVQEYGESNQGTTSIPDSSTSRGTILEPSGVGIPSWIKYNADWWSGGLITDREFASGIGYLIKEEIINVGNIQTDSKGEIQIDETISIPTWIKNVARWWSEDSISDNDFKLGIQYLVNEKIIQFTPKESCLLDGFCKPLIDALQNKLPIPSSSHVFYAKVEPGTILKEDFDLKNSPSLEVPNIDGDYYAFYIDYNPGAKFAHTVAYAWLDFQSMRFDYMLADWPPVIFQNNQVLSYSPSTDYVTVGDVVFQPEIWEVKGDTDEDKKREPVFDVSKKQIASGPAPKSIKPYQKIALLIDLGDNPPRSLASLDVAEEMAKDADGIQKYLDDSGYQTNRVSNYHGNDHPRVDSADDLKQLLEAYSKAFDCDPEIPCGHEFFLFLDGHGSRPFQVNETGKWIGAALNIYKADGSGNPEEGGFISESSINSILKGFEPCVKIIVFIDSCYGGSMIQDSFEILQEACEKKPCGMTIMAGNSKRESTFVLDGAPAKFLAGSDKDYDGDGVKGDLRDRFEEMKRLQKQDIRLTRGGENPFMDDGMDAQLFLCSQNQPLCSLDGPVRSGLNDNVRGVHIAPFENILIQDTSGDILDSGNGTFVQIPSSFPPLESSIGFNPVPVPTDSSLLPGSEMYNDLEPSLSSNNASWLGEKRIGETFSIGDVTFWVETPRLPAGYFYTGKLYPAIAVEGPIDSKGYTDIESLGKGAYKGSFTFECWLEGNAKVTQLVSLYWQLWKGDNPNDLSSATKITQGIMSSDRESRLECKGAAESPEDTGLYIDSDSVFEYHDMTISKEDLRELDTNAANAITITVSLSEDLLEIKNFEFDYIQDLSNQFWEDYDDSKDIDHMEAAIELEEFSDVLEDEVTVSLDLLKLSKENYDQFYSVVDDSGEDSFSLEQIALDSVGDPEDVDKVNSIKDRESALDLFDDKIKVIRDNLRIIDLNLGVNNAISSQGFEKGICQKYPVNVQDPILNSFLKSMYGPDKALCKVFLLYTSDHGSLDENFRGSTESYQDSQPSEESSETSDSSSSTENTFSVKVLVISGNDYPISQFTKWKWIGECGDDWHYHSPTSHAVNLDLLGIPDPDPEECGFGKESQIPTKVVSLTESQVNAFEELTGIDPTVNSAIYGGEGP